MVATPLFLFFPHCLFFLRYLECPSVAFKSTISNTKCIQCPLNSVSNTERTTCSCDEGFYKSFDLADCKGITFMQAYNHVLSTLNHVGSPHFSSGKGGHGPIS